MVVVAETPLLLREGRRALEGMAGVQILEDLSRIPGVTAWMLRLRISISDLPKNERVPASTEWVAVISERYPWGDIEVHPALERGITATFPHQRYNGVGKVFPFRTGAICVHSGLQDLGRPSLDTEPYEAGRRLRWRIERTIDWIRAAAKNDLRRVDEPYELPALPNHDDANVERLAFIEDALTFRSWSSIRERSGLVDVIHQKAIESTFLVSTFRDSNTTKLVTPPWSSETLKDGEELNTAIWFRLEHPPVLEPFRAPATWDELREACRSGGLDLDRAMRPLLRGVRDGRHHMCLLGFPIPERVGAEVTRLHWYALQLPKLEPRPTHGFRSNEKGLWDRDRHVSFGSSAKLAWLKTQNWSDEQLTSRGRAAGALRDQRIILLGAGALGSVVAELLVRGGVRDLLIVDDDTLEAGNLVRHTLTLREVGEVKAEALAARLNAVSPHARVRWSDSKLPPANDPAMAESTLVIDCTANDAVVYDSLAVFQSKPRTFASLAFGLDAKRIFCFFAHGEAFPSARYRDALAPWLMDEREAVTGKELPREGIGCWSPVFPARIEDICCLASLAVRALERSVQSPPIDPLLVVYELGEEGAVRVTAPRRSA